MIIFYFLESDLNEAMLSGNSCEQASPGNILQCKTLEICQEKGCSFGEAFPEACLENPELTQIYYEYIRGL